MTNFNTLQVTFASLVATAGAASTAHATPTLTSLASNVAHAAPIIDAGVGLGLSPGVIAEQTSGAFEQLTFDGTQWHTEAIPGLVASGGKGLAVAFNDNDNGTYVFEVENGGLYETRSLDGVTWSPVCHVDPRADLVSAPAAVYNSYGGFRVFAQTTTNTLVEWAVDEPGGYCQTSTTEQIGFTYAPPVAVSWGDSRVDLFGATSAGDLVHFWSSDGANYQDQTTFSIGGSNVALPVARSHDSLAVTSTENGSLDLFYFTGARIDRLFWRGGTGWSNVVAGPLETQAIVAASVLPIDDSYDPDGAFYASPAQGAGSILVESTGVEENFDIAVPAEALTELSSATLEADGVHVVFGVGGGTLYWTATGDGT